MTCFGQTAILRAAPITVLPKTNALPWKKGWRISSQFWGSHQFFQYFFSCRTNRFLALKPERLAIVLEELPQLGLSVSFFAIFPFCSGNLERQWSFSARLQTQMLSFFFVFLVRFFVHRRELASFVFFFVFEFLSLFLCFCAF